MHRMQRDAQKLARIQSSKRSKSIVSSNTDMHASVGAKLLPPLLPNHPLTPPFSVARDRVSVGQGSETVTFVQIL